MKSQFFISTSICNTCKCSYKLAPKICLWTKLFLPAFYHIYWKLDVYKPFYRIIFNLRAVFKQKAMCIKHKELYNNCSLIKFMTIQGLCNLLIRNISGFHFEFLLWNFIIPEWSCKRLRFVYCPSCKRLRFSVNVAALFGSHPTIVLSNYDVIREAIVKRSDAFSSRPEFLYILTKILSKDGKRRGIVGVFMFMMI